jgi:hypothetical protein
MIRGVENPNFSYHTNQYTNQRDISQREFFRWASLKVSIRTTAALQVEARGTTNAM